MFESRQINQTLLKILDDPLEFAEHLFRDAPGHFLSYVQESSNGHEIIAAYVLKDREVSLYLPSEPIEESRLKSQQALLAKTRIKQCLGQVVVAKAGEILQIFNSPLEWMELVEHLPPLPYKVAFDGSSYVALSPGGNNYLATKGLALQPVPTRLRFEKHSDLRF